MPYTTQQKISLFFFSYPDLTPIFTLIKKNNNLAGGQAGKKISCNVIHTAVSEYVRAQSYLSHVEPEKI